MRNKKIILVLLAATLITATGCKKKDNVTDNLSNINGILQESINRAESVQADNKNNNAETPENNTGVSDNTSNSENDIENKNNSNSIPSDNTPSNTPSVNSNRQKVPENALYLIPKDNSNIVATAFMSGNYISFYNDFSLLGGVYDFSSKMTNPTFSVSFNKYSLTDDGVKTMTESRAYEKIGDMIMKQSEESLICKYSCDNIQYDSSGNITELDLQKRTMYLQKTKDGQYTDKYDNPVTYKVVNESEFYETIQNFFKG